MSPESAQLRTLEQPCTCPRPAQGAHGRGWSRVGRAPNTQGPQRPCLAGNQALKPSSQPAALAPAIMRSAPQGRGGRNWPGEPSPRAGPGPRLSPHTYPECQPGPGTHLPTLPGEQAEARRGQPCAEQKRRAGASPSQARSLPPAQEPGTQGSSTEPKVGSAQDAHSSALRSQLPTASSYRPALGPQGPTSIPSGQLSERLSPPDTVVGAAPP